MLGAPAFLVLACSAGLHKLVRVIAEQTDLTVSEVQDSSSAVGPAGYASAYSGDPDQYATRGLR